MKVTAVLEERYVPKWNGNRELPDAEQVTVEIKWPTNAERENLKGYKISPQTSEVSVYFNTERILENHVTKVTGLEVSQNGKTVKIKNGHDLAASNVLALGGLIDEIKAYVTSEDGLTEEQEKN